MLLTGDFSCFYLPYLQTVPTLLGNDFGFVNKQLFLLYNNIIQITP
jgi:hypothetical protein